MKNILIMAKDKQIIPKLETIDSKTNEIFVKFIGIGENAKIALYYGTVFRQSITITENTEVKIPEEYYRDSEIWRFRYEDNEVISNFIHIIGDENKFSDLILVRKSNCVFECGGIEKTSKVVNFLEKLAKLISKSTIATAEDCYRSLLSCEDMLNKQLWRLGGEEGGTVKESVENLAVVESGTGNGNIIIHYIKISKLEDDSQTIKIKEIQE